MMGDLLSDVEAARVVRVVIPATEELAKDGIVRLLHALGLDVPAGEIILENANEALFGIITFLSAAVVGSGEDGCI